MMEIIYLVILAEVCAMKALCAIECVDNSPEWTHDFDLICRTARYLQGSWRGVETPGGDNCDSDLETGWYRVLTADGSPARIPTVCIKNNACGTRLPLRVDMDGKSMPGRGETIQASLCGSFPVFGYWDCCVLKQNTLIHNCGDFYIYWLKATDRCSVGYCVQGGQDKLEHLTVKTGEKVYDTDSQSHGDMMRPERNAEPSRLTRSPIICTGDNLACDDGSTCYKKEYRCDDYADCSDNSDEQNCHNIPRSCPEGQKACADGQCRDYCKRKRIPESNHQNTTHSPVDNRTILQDEGKDFINKTIKKESNDNQTYHLPSNSDDLPSTIIGNDRDTEMTSMEHASSYITEDSTVVLPSLEYILSTSSTSHLDKRHSINTYSTLVYSSFDNTVFGFVTDTKVVGVFYITESLLESRKSFLQRSEFYKTHQTDSNTPIATRQHVSESLLLTPVYEDSETYSHVPTLMSEAHSFQSSEITPKVDEIFYSEHSVTESLQQKTIYTKTSEQPQLFTVSSYKLSPTSPLISFTESHFGLKSLLSSPTTNDYGKTFDVKDKDMVNPSPVSSLATSEYVRTTDTIYPTPMLSQTTSHYGRTLDIKDKDKVNPSSVLSFVESSDVSTAATDDNIMKSTEGVDGVQSASEQWSPCSQCIKLVFFSIEGRSATFLSRLKVLLAMMLNRYYKTVLGSQTSRRWLRSTATQIWPNFKSSDIFVRNSTFSKPFTEVYIEAKLPTNKTDDFLPATELFKFFQSDVSRHFLAEELKKFNVTLEDFSIHGETNTTDNFTNTTVETVTADDEEQSIFMQHFGLFLTVIIISIFLVFVIIVAIVYLRAKDRIGFWQCPSGEVYVKQVEKSLIKSKNNTGTGQVESPFPDFDILQDEQQMTETPSPEVKCSNNGLSNNSYIDQDTFDGSGWIVPITKNLDDSPDVDYIVEDTKL